VIGDDTRLEGETTAKDSGVLVIAWPQLMQRRVCKGLPTSTSLFGLGCENSCPHLAEVLDKMVGTPYSDWIVTSEFYAALHYVEAFFDTLYPPIHHRKHLFREKTIEEREETSPLYEDYRSLKDLSEKARYFGQHVSAERVRAEVFPSLAFIKRSLDPYLH